ncbi:MAG: hypothetical protein AB7V01_13030, partial [Vicinamibacterales bacterium]
MSVAPDELVRRLSAAVRAAELYAPGHPLVQRTAGGLHQAVTEALTAAPTVIVGFLDGEVVVNDFRLPRNSATLTGLLRDMRERQVEKITFARGVEATDVRALLDELRDRSARTGIGDRLSARGIRRVQVGRVAADEEDTEPGGREAAKQMSAKAVSTAEQIWAA